MKPELGEGAVMPVGGAAWGSPGPTGRSAGCSSGRCLWTAASSGSPGTAPCWPGAPCSWLPGGTGAVRDALASAYAAAPPGMPALLTPLCPENLQGYVSELQAANVCPVPCSRGEITEHPLYAKLGAGLSGLLLGGERGTARSCRGGNTGLATYEGLPKAMSHSGSAAVP